MCWYWPDKSCGQATVTTLLNLHAAGMPSLDVIRAITVNAAEMLGMQNDLGSIAPGKYADLVAVKGDPLADISRLQKIDFVMKGGEVYKSGDRVIR